MRTFGKLFLLGLMLLGLAAHDGGCCEGDHGAGDAGHSADAGRDGG